MRLLAVLASAAVASLVAGCDMLGIESAEKTAAAREADGKAIGSACRHAGRAIEDCFAIYKKADRGGAEISGDPRSLASALEKIHAYSRGTPLIAAERNPATAQMMIINPLHAGGLTSLFSTHPATEERVARLLAMAGAMRR